MVAQKTAQQFSSLKVTVPYSVFPKKYSWKKIESPDFET